MYEHVYETVEIEGNPEVRAQATAKVGIGRYSHIKGLYRNILD